MVKKLSGIRKGIPGQILQLVLVLLATAAPALPQRFSVGLRGGVPFTDYFAGGGNFSSKTNRYTIGPALELQLPFRLGVEFDAFYKRLHYLREDHSKPLGAPTSREVSTAATSLPERRLLSGKGG
jgi:hypothetical protein